MIYVAWILKSYLKETFVSAEKCIKSSLNFILISFLFRIYFPLCFTVAFLFYFFSFWTHFFQFCFTLLVVLFLCAACTLVVAAIVVVVVAFGLHCFCCRLCLYLGHKFLKLKRKYFFLYVACTMRSANAKSWKLAVKHYFWYVNRAWHAIFILFGRLFKFRNTWLTLATTLTSRFKFLMGSQRGQQLLSLLLLLSFNYSSRCCAMNYATKYNANELGAAAHSLASTHALKQTLTQA